MTRPILSRSGIDRSTLAEMIRRMIDKGFVDRERTETDQRAKRCAIAMAGKKAFERRAIRKRSRERTLLAGSCREPGEIFEDAVDRGLAGRSEDSSEPRAKGAAALGPSFQTLCRVAPPRAWDRPVRRRSAPSAPGGICKIERARRRVASWPRRWPLVKLRSEEEVGCIDPHRRTMAKDGFQNLKGR